jgi:5'-3' exonuclease
VGRRSQHRLALFPEYKANRKAAEAADPEKAAERSAYRAQVPLIQASMKALGVRQMKCHVLEADDLAGYLAPKLSAAGQNVLLVTGDSDWWQLVNERVSWLDPRQDGRRVNHSQLPRADRVSHPGRIPASEGPHGRLDRRHPARGGIGEKGAQELMARFKSVPEFWRQCDAGTFVPTTKAHQRLWKGIGPSKEQWAAQATDADKADEKAFKKYMLQWPGDTRANWVRNMKLMSLLRVPKPAPETMHIEQGDFDADKFKAICERLAFVSLLKDFNTFVEPFAKQWAARQVKAA